jgi:hypothetical protein
MEAKMSKRYAVGNRGNLGLSSVNLSANRGLIVGVILILALIAFEIFNFDTTQFALESLLGNVTFLGLQWATILAIAFCSIDFAGLNRLFTPDGGGREQREVWFLMGAWLLGATMNAVMTWWAVSVTLLNNNFGNEVLSREQLLRYVPVFVAVLVWLTRILFIGSFSIAGETIFDKKRGLRAKKGNQAATGQAPRVGSSRNTAPARINAAPQRAHNPAPKAVAKDSPTPVTASVTAPSRSSRVRQRPPMPNSGLRQSNGGLQARSK